MTARTAHNSALPDAPVDIAVVGAGSAGAAAAMWCAQRGFEVVCLERGRLEEAGARWINCVPGWCFDEVDLPRPSAPELVARGQRFHLIAGFGTERVTIEGHDVLEVDMRHLVARLQEAARRYGARLFASTRVEGIDDGRLLTSRGPVKARWYIDASGLAGARLLDHPTPAPEDLCAAAQEVREVTDMAAARRFCLEHGARPGETICFSGIAGGYSVLNVRIGQGHVSLLTGSVPATGHASGRSLLRDFVCSQPWIGERRFGGHRAIPLGAARESLSKGAVAAIGDAARQVFAAHGSGVGAGLLAARMLADSLSNGGGLEGYARGWKRRFGAHFARYDVFRRFSQSLSVQDLSRMMEAGLLDPRVAAATLEQRPPTTSPRLVADTLRAAIRAPDLALRMLPVALRMSLTGRTWRG